MKRLHPCVKCGELTPNDKYCGRACAQAARRAEEDKRILQLDGAGISAGALRRYFLRRSSRCQICGIAHWHGQAVPLVLDHIDGDSGNNSLRNLRLICANCDALLPTFKSRNRGKGRAWRRERYHAGKSY